MQSRRKHKGKETPPPPPPPPPASCPFFLKDCSLFLVVSAKPNSKETLVTSLDEESVSVCVGAPAKDNEANKELLLYMARLFSVRKSDVSLEKGGKSRHKVVRVENSGMGVEEVERVLKGEL